MNKSRVIFFFGVLAIVVSIARCNSRTTTQTTETKSAAPSGSPASNSLLIPPPITAPVTSPSASAALAEASAGPDFKTTAERITPAVLSLSVFDTSGRLLRNGTGFFISDDGKLVTSRSIIDGGSHAVAKSNDGKIYNVNGVLADDTASDVAVLKAQVKERVPFVAPNKTAPFEAGAPLAAIGSPGDRHRDPISQTSIAGRKSNGKNEWLELTKPVPGESLGAPVITAKGDVLGFVALQRGEGPAINVVRMASALDPVLSRIDPRAKPTWAAVSPETSPSPPAEGPLEAPKPTPPALVQTGKLQLIYSPTPQYPMAARRARFPVVKSTGRYRIHFTRDGSVRDVQVVQSTQNQLLDGAAIETLRKWKATPGQEWTANVPITFQP
jgi:TonB family protein